MLNAVYRAWTGEDFSVPVGLKLPCTVASVGIVTLIITFVESEIDLNPGGSVAKVLRLCPCASVSLFVCRALLELILQREMGKKVR